MVSDKWQYPNSHERQGHEHPSPLRMKCNRGERDVDQIEKGERILWPPCEVQKQREQHDVQRHQRRHLVLANFGFGSRQPECDGAIGSSFNRDDQ